MIGALYEVENSTGVWCPKGTMWTIHLAWLALSFRNLMISMFFKATKEMLVLVMLHKTEVLAIKLV